MYGNLTIRYAYTWQLDQMLLGAYVYHMVICTEFEYVAKQLYGYNGAGEAPGGGPFLLANMTEFGQAS